MSEGSNSALQHQETSEVINERFQVNPVMEDIPNDAAELPNTSERIYNTVGAEDFRVYNKPKVKRKISEHSFKVQMQRSSSRLSDKPNNMVLQLVLSPETNREDTNYLTSSSSNDESLRSNLIKFRDRSRVGSEVGSLQEIRERVQSTFYTGREPSELGNPVLQQIYTPNGGGDVHVENEKVANEKGWSESTSAQDKQRMFRKHITIILSCIYAVFIVTLGLVVYISDIIIIGGSTLAETFSIYLLIIGFVYMVYLVVDIRIYVNKTAHRYRYRNSGGKVSEVRCMESLEGDLHLSVPIPSLSQILYDSQPNRYCFSKGRHSGSFYLKVGAAGFCLGHLIHSGLLLGYQIVFLTSDGEAFYKCASILTLILDITYPVYSFFLLYFIFKYSNVIINVRPELHRFAIMHCIASSLCFWIWTILREITDSLSHAKKESNKNNATNTTELYSKYNKPETRIGTICMDDARLDVIYTNYSPYLYPFTVEYSILVVGVLYIIWQNIDKCHEEEDSNGYYKKRCPTPGLNKENGFSSNLVINVDCHSANTGLFCGIIVLVFAIVSIILYFIATSSKEHIYLGVLINNITELLFLILMTISAIFAYYKIKTLDINYHPVSLLDDLLLFICIPAFFVNAIFSMVPAVKEKMPLSIATIILEVAQILIQTPMIIDGLRRCSNTNTLHLTKPGRGLITFLIVCNIAMWITDTFEIKSQVLYDVRYEFYGKVWWTIIGHVTVPLMMFYRFHSSVCLVDIWKSAYEPEEKH